MSKQGRASGFRLTLTVFAMVQEIMSDRRRGTVPTLQASPQALTRMLEEKEPINPALKLQMKSIFDRFEQLVRQTSTKITTKRWRINADSAFDAAPNFLRGDGFDHVRTFSPLELICSGLLISYHMNTRDDKQLLEDVKEMRRHLRLKHKDLRVNAQCWTTAWEYIIEIGSERSNSTTEEAGLPEARDEYPAMKAAPRRAPRNSKGSGIQGPDIDSGTKKANSSTQVTSKEATVSSLGQSMAGLGVNGDTNDSDQREAPKQAGVEPTSLSNDININHPPKLSVRTTVANSEEMSTLGMSSRVTTGHYEANASRVGSNRSSKHPSSDDPEDNMMSDSSESLSSVSSDALHIPDTQKPNAPGQKRSLDNDDPDIADHRRLKKAKN